MFLRTPPEISRQNFWCNQNFQKKITGSSTRCKPEILIFWCGFHTSKSPWLHSYFLLDPINALVSSNINLGKKLPKNDATITRKKDDATVKPPLNGPLPMMT